MKESLKVIWYYIMMRHNWRVMRNIANNTGQSHLLLMNKSMQYRQASVIYNRTKRWLSDNGYYVEASNLITNRTPA